jgi:hypothetical protein
MLTFLQTDSAMKNPLPFWKKMLDKLTQPSHHELRDVDMAEYRRKIKERRDAEKKKQHYKKKKRSSSQNPKWNCAFISEKHYLNVISCR